MVNREQLKSAGLRAYELGRLRAAARTAWVLVPLVVLCALLTGAHETCGCAGFLLLGASVFLRWRNRSGANAVRRGLQAGALPLVAGLLVARFAPECASAPLFSACTVLSLAIGTPAGLWLGFRMSRGTSASAEWFGAGGVAVLAATLGCVGLGVAGLLGVSAGLLLGLTSSSALARSAG